MDFVLGGIFATCINCYPAIQQEVVIQQQVTVIQQPILQQIVVQPVFVGVMYPRPLPKLFCNGGDCYYTRYY